MNLNDVLAHPSYVHFYLVELITDADRQHVLRSVSFSCGGTHPYSCVAKFIPYVRHNGIEDVGVRLSQEALVMPWIGSVGVIGVGRVGMMGK